MIEYPSIDGPSKSPRKLCTAFEKLDGSNIRVKYTHKKGFHVFGSRREYIDKNHPHLGRVIDIFNVSHAPVLSQIFEREFFNEKEIIVFGEFYGPSSIGGIHKIGEPMTFTMFDVMLVKKGYNEFLKPKQFIKLFQDHVNIPKVVYEGNLNEPFIKDVQEGKYDVNEGVICKGHESMGSYCGKQWTCKIKTFAYLEKLKAHYGQEWEIYV
jgi:hypothetical protein